MKENERVDLMNKIVHTRLICCKENEKKTQVMLFYPIKFVLDCVGYTDLMLDLNLVKPTSYILRSRLHR